MLPAPSDCGKVGYVPALQNGHDTVHAEAAEPATWRHPTEVSAHVPSAKAFRGVVVHHMLNPSRDDYGDIDYRELCPQGAELMVFVTQLICHHMGPPHWTATPSRWTAS